MSDDPYGSDPPLVPTPNAPVAPGFGPLASVPGAPTVRAPEPVQVATAPPTLRLPPPAPANPQQAFFNTWAPYAQQAGEALGVHPNTILAQWAHESDFGQSRVSRVSGNLAGINVPGGRGQDYASYNSPQDFTNAYIRTMMHPGYEAARNTGTDARAFVAGLVSTPGHHYFTDNPTSYANRVSSIAATDPMGNLSSIQSRANNELGVGMSPGMGDPSLLPRNFSGPQLAVAPSASTNALGLKLTGGEAPLPGSGRGATGQAQDVNGLMMLGLLGKLVPSTHTLQPVHYDPFVTPHQESSLKMAAPEMAPKLHPIPAATPVSQVNRVSLVPGAAMSVQGQLQRVTGDTGAPSVRGSARGAGSLAQYE